MILTEVQQPGVTLSEVCRKHSVSPALVYRWRAVAQQATTRALQKVDSRGKSQPDAQTARLQAELDRMRRVIAGITAENLELKNSRNGRSRSAQCAKEIGGLGLGRAHAATVTVASSVHPMQQRAQLAYHLPHHRSGAWLPSCFVAK